MILKSLFLQKRSNKIMSYTIRTTVAFIVFCAPRGEADQVVHALTEEFGLVIALAKGVRHMKSKLRPYLLPYRISLISFVKGKDFWRVVNAEPYLPTELNFDLGQKALRERASLATLLRRLIQGEELKPKVFREVFNFINFVMRNILTDEEITRALVLAEFRVLWSLGYIGEQIEIDNLTQNDLMWHKDIVSAKIPLSILHRNIEKALISSHL